MERPALRGTWLGRVLRVWNPVMLRLLASPLHGTVSRWFALLEYRGRRSGRPYVTPVSYVREGRTVYLTSGDRWTVNLADPAPVRVRLRRRWRPGQAVVVADRDEAIREQARLFRARPFFRRLAGFSVGAHDDVDPEQLGRAVDAGRRLIRIELDDGPAS